VRRITVVYYSDAPFYGGAEHYLRLLATGLARDSFDVHVILRPLETLRDLRVPLEERGIPILDPGEPSLPDPRHWISVYKYLRRVKADIFHVNLPGPYDGLSGSIPVVGKLAGTRVVTTEHLPMVRGRWRRVVAKRVSRCFVDLTITVSESNVCSLTSIHAIPRSAIRRVYNGVDLSRYPANGNARRARHNLGLSDGEKGIGIIGRLAPMKGHQFFLEAARQVHEEMPGTHFFIIGDGWLRRSLEEMARDLGLRTAVHFLGYRKDVPTILEALDVIVLSSTREGMPFVLLEALAMAKPVVATDVYGLGEIVREILRSPGNAKAMGATAREVVAKEFSLAEMLCQTAEIYESLIE
jgi:glycosyltransferase involved in cell wall biosynthesis